MSDVGTHHFVKSSAKSDQVLVPQPSSDPSDPLVSPSMDVDFGNTRKGSVLTTVFIRIGALFGSFRP